MSIVTISAAFKAAAYSAGFATNNVLFDYSEGINPNRKATDFPVLLCVPPEVPIAVNKDYYRTTLNIFAFKGGDVQETVWGELEAYIKSWAQYVTSQKSLMRIIDIKCQYLVKGQAVNDVYAVKAAVQVEVQCQSNTI